MRLDNDSSKTAQSPSRNFTNGSSQSSAPRSPLGKNTNGSPHSRNESNGSYTNGGPVANGASVPATFFGHDREEVTRILIQSLTDLGYHGAASALCKESGFQLEGPTVAAFRSSVLNGDWEEAEELLFGSNTSDNGGGVGLDAPYGKSWGGKSRSKSGSQRSAGLTLAEGANREVMLFWLKQQKYLELLERRDLSKALAVLRQELTPLHQDVGRLHALSALVLIRCMFCLPLSANSHQVYDVPICRGLEASGPMGRCSRRVANASPLGSFEYVAILSLQGWLLTPYRIHLA